MKVLTIGNSLLKHILHPDTWNPANNNVPGFHQSQFIKNRYIADKMRNNYGDSWRCELEIGNYDAICFEQCLIHNFSYDPRFRHLNAVLKLFSETGVPPISLSLFAKECESCPIFQYFENSDNNRTELSMQEAYEMLKAFYNGKCCGFCDSCELIDHNVFYWLALDSGVSKEVAIELSLQLVATRSKRRI